MRQINPSNNNGAIRIRFTLTGRSFNIGLPGYRWDCPIDRSRAIALASTIAADIHQDCFDQTLARYQPPKLILLAAPRSELEVWDNWVASLGLNDHTLAGHYRTTRRALERGDLFKTGLSPFTHNLRRRLITAAYAHAEQASPYERIKTRRSLRAPIDIFKPSELRAILSTVGRLSPHYEPFTRFLMLSGCRFGEAAGVRWADLDLDALTIRIASSVSYSQLSGKMEHKPSTKTGSIRELKSTALMGAVKSAPKPLRPSPLIFTSARGCLIRHTKYCQLVWQPALKAAQVSYRRIHILRHTALSHALAAGLSVPEVAYLAGHADGSMIVRTYGHILDRPSLPDMQL
jgi:integrase